VRTAHQWLAGAIIVGTVLACGGAGQNGTGQDGSTRTGQVAAKLEIVAGEGQSGVAGVELSQAVVVRVSDATGVPVAGQVINFVVTAGGGHVFAGVALSNAAGEARERWTLGPGIGPQRLEARAVDATTGAALVFATFSADAVAGPPAQVRVASGNLVGTLGTQLSAAAAVLDANGNAVAGVPVTFAVTAGGGSVDPETAVTNDAGLASTTWMLGSSGDQLLEARVSGLSPAVFVPTPGPTFTVTVNNQGGGTVGDGTKTCAANSTCNWTYATGTTVKLTANAGSLYFDGWFGNCSGTGDCTLSGNSDQYVVASFSATPQRHPNFTDPAVHGPAYDAFVAGDPGSLQCTTCHGANLLGQGLAPSCAACHAWPVLASPQVSVVESSDFPNGSDEIINIPECKGEVRSQFSISWKVPTTAGTVSTIDIRISDTAGCPLTSTLNTAKTTSLGTSTSTSGALASARAASDLAAAVGITCGDGVLRTVNICAVALSGGMELTNATQSATIQFDQRGAP
jgi:hypothetical protein